MKTKFLFGMATLSLFMANCSNDEMIEGAFSQGTLVTAVIDNEGETRSDVTDAGVFTWSAGDVISVYGSNNTWIASSSLSTGGQTTASFSVTYPNGVNANGYAVYPSNSAHKVDNGTLKINMPTEYDYSSSETYTANTNAPMVAEAGVGTQPTSFTFKHVGAVLRFIVKNIPTGANQFVYTAVGKRITGEFSVNGGKIANETSTDESNQSVTIKFKKLTATVSEMKFFIPIPTGTYQNYKIQVKNGNGEVLGEFESQISTSYEIARRALMLGPTLICTDASIEQEPVKTAEELTTAIANGGTVRLDSESGTITVSEDLNVSTTTTIDLNGQSLNLGNNSITVSENQTLTIVDNGTSTVGRTAVASTIESTSDIIHAKAGSTIKIGAGVNLKTTGASMSCIYASSSDENVTIETAGNLTCTTAGAAVISHNGSLSTGTIKVTGGSITHEADVAIYIAGKADLTISGGAIIKGTTGVEVRAGSLTIEDAQIEATGNPLTATPNGNGTTTTGAAIAISQHTTNKAITATIENGTFKGVNALYEADLQAEDKIASDITLSVTGGTFNGKVYSASCSAFIAGGTFSDASAFDYLADGANVTVGDDMEITKAITITKNATIDLNGKTIENKTAASTTGLDTAEDECIVFFVNGTDANLTINATNGGKVTATGDGSKSYYNVAVWAMNSANVTINGGEYTNTADPKNDGCDLIYGRNGAKIAITGGTFKAGAIRSTLGGGVYGVLNCKDKDEAKGIALSTITVSGGKYYEFGATEAGKVGNGEVILLGAGYQWSDKDSEGYYTVETAN